jgi:AcrR family transcriptional regulator
MTTKTRKRLPRAEREERMLDAAEAAFGKRGFQGASMDEIARRSGITKALLYQYFGSKEGLCEATVERGVAHMFEALERATAAAPPGLPQVVAFVRGYFDYVEAHRSSFWLHYAEASAPVVNRMRERNADVIAGLIARGFEQLGRAADPEAIELLSQYLVGAGEQAARWWAERPDFPKDVLVTRFTEATVAAIATAFEAAPLSR